MCINVREEQGDNKWGRIRELMRVKESKKKREGVLINSYQNMEKDQITNIWNDGRDNNLEFLGKGHSYFVP